MKIEKEHKQRTLMRWSKRELVEHIMVLEHNNNVLHETIHQQFINFSEMMKEKTAKWIAKDDKGNGVCSMCNRQDKIDPLATHCRYCGSRMESA